MAYVVKLGEQKPADPGDSIAEKVSAEWESPVKRTKISILLAVTLAAAVGFGVQALPSIRAALFPIASRDLPADADPSPIPTLQEAGVFDRSVPGNVKRPGEEGKAAVVAEDPTERPFVRGASSTGQ